MTEAAPYLGDGPERGFARWLKAADGVRLRAVFWPLAGARGTVLMLPGRTEHAEKYGPTAERLAAAGYAAASVDWRGQGLADRLLPDRRKGHVGRFSDYQHDLTAYAAAARAQGLPGPCFLLAHSMGGCIGLRGLMRGLDVAAAAFSAPMWGLDMPGGRARLFGTLFGLAAGAGLRAAYSPPPASGPVCYLETAPFAGNTLTTDPAVWDWMQGQLRRTPEIALAGPTIGWVAEALAETRALAALPSPSVPCITGLGGNERIVSRAAIESRMARWPGGTLLPVPGAEHELLMEAAPMRDAFLAAVLALFARHSAPRPA